MASSGAGTSTFGSPIRERQVLSIAGRGAHRSADRRTAGRPRAHGDHAPRPDLREARRGHPDGGRPQRRALGPRERRRGRVGLRPGSAALRPRPRRRPATAGRPGDAGGSSQSASATIASTSHVSRRLLPARAGERHLLVGIPDGRGVQLDAGVDEDRDCRVSRTRTTSAQGWCTSSRVAGRQPVLAQPRSARRGVVEHPVLGDAPEPAGAPARRRCRGLPRPRDAGSRPLLRASARRASGVAGTSSLAMTTGNTIAHQTADRWAKNAGTRKTASQTQLAPGRGVLPPRQPHADGQDRTRP